MLIYLYIHIHMIMMMMMFAYIEIATRGCHKIYTLKASIQASQKGISTKKYQ
jgi:hypothetical protein